MLTRIPGMFIASAADNAMKVTNTEAAAMALVDRALAMHVRPT